MILGAYCVAFITIEAVLDVADVVDVVIDVDDDDEVREH